uniref:Uncharacterized protein n=1 Tax=Leersia perrieri TaxID=77586 RepID=A0A0D9XZ16_9ORYZ
MVNVELSNPVQQSAARKFYMGGGLGGPPSNFSPSLVEPWIPKLLQEYHNSFTSAVDTNKDDKNIQAGQGEIARAFVKNSIPSSSGQCAAPFTGGQKRKLSNWSTLSAEENILFPFPRIRTHASTWPSTRDRISNSTCYPFAKSVISSAEENRNAKACLVPRNFQFCCGYRTPGTSSSQSVLQSTSNLSPNFVRERTIFFWRQHKPAPNQRRLLSILLRLLH